MKAIGLSMGLLAAASLEAQIPFARFQADYFSEMPRAFGVINKLDLKERRLTVRLDKDSRIVTVPIQPDTELHIRDSWGELDDFFEGQHIMLFMYVDDAKHWTYPRTVQDDVHVSARHGWFSRVLRIDRGKQTFVVSKQGVNADGTPAAAAFEKEYTYLPTTKVWKGSSPAGPEALSEGDEVIQQLIERDASLIAIEIMDRAGTDTVRALQEQRHRKDQDRLGLPGYINDFEPLSGFLLLSIAPGGVERGAELTAGTVVAITPAEGDTFAARITSGIKLDTRQRLQAAINPRVAVRLQRGMGLRIFLPNTGPAIPTGRAGIPETSK